jgi:dihydrofolate reductase
MSKVVVSEFVTADGVFEDPGGAEGFDRGGWAFKFNRGSDGDKFKQDELTAAGALLLGRITYEGFAAAWPGRQDDAFGKKINSMPKYVVSRTLQRADWTNSTVIDGDLTATVTALKEQVDGDILVNGSGQLVRGLAELGLVEEYRLMVYPLALGRGKRLFDGLADAMALRLADAHPAGETMIFTYEPR